MSGCQSTNHLMFISPGPLLKYKGKGVQNWKYICSCRIFSKLTSILRLFIFSSFCLLFLLYIWILTKFSVVNQYYVRICPTCFFLSIFITRPTPPPLNLCIGLLVSYLIRKIWRALKFSQNWCIHLAFIADYYMKYLDLPRSFFLCLCISIP